MRVIEISEFGGPEVLKMTKRPKATAGAGEILIQVKAAGVNRPDIVQRQGFYPPPEGASDIPGLEVAGVVESVGFGVQNFAIGQRVCALLTGGGYARYATAPAECVLPLPVGMDFIMGAAIPETYFTTWSNLMDRAGLRRGQTLLVHGGSSGIGTTAIQLAKAQGAHVFTTVGSQEKAEFCLGLGADHVIDYKKQDFEQYILQQTKGKGVDIVLDMVGGDYMTRNIACLAQDGCHLSIAFLQGSKVKIDMLPVMLKRLTLTGSTLRARDKAFKGAIAAALKDHVWPLLAEGKCLPQIYQTFPLAEASKAHALMESSKHRGKIVLTL